MIVRLVVVLLLAVAKSIVCVGEIMFALNAGGESLTDSYGIHYRRDNLDVGVASDYGKSLNIARVVPNDRIIYQTERYATETFGYDIDLPKATDADYVLWLKFSEVWFNAPNLKVFDVTLNGIVVVKDLDIFARAGRGIAHDEVVPFRIKQNKLFVGDQSTSFNKQLRVEFVKVLFTLDSKYIPTHIHHLIIIKTEFDNPKVNAIIVMKGTPDRKLFIVSIDTKHGLF